MLLVELFNSIINILISKAGTDLPINQAALDFVPIFITIHPLLQPTGVIPKPILLITTIRQDLTGALVRNDKSENGERKENNNKNKHYKKVNP